MIYITVSHGNRDQGGDMRFLTRGRSTPGWIWGVLVALCVIGCVEDPEEGDAPDAEPRDMEMRVVRIDRGVIDLGADAAPDAARDTDGMVDTDGGDDGDMAPRAACSNGLDDDGDGVVDHPDDPGCDSPDDDDETDPIPPPECNDGLDNDADNRVDRDDPDCSSELDPTEGGEDPEAECSDGLDNDENGDTDWPLDPGCHAAGDPTEGSVDVAACANGEDDDGDGLVDYPLDPGCGGRGDRNEDDPERPAQCSDGEDNDGNGTTDYPDDPGCDAAGDNSEVGPCGADAEVVDLNAWLAENEFYDGTTVDAPANTVGSCGGNAGGERIFSFRVDRPLEAISFSTNHPETASAVVMYVRRDCLGAADIACDRGTADVPGRVLTLEDPPEGLYFLYIDTGRRDGGGAFRLSVDVVGPPECGDTLDNDGDGAIDADDPGCEGRFDRDEADPDMPAVCNDGLDNDMDGAIDYPEDADCVARGAPREEPLCAIAEAIFEVGQDGGIFDVPILDGGQGAAQGTCEPGLSPDHLFILELEDPSAVTVQVLEQNVPAAAAIHLRTDCADVASEVGCRRSGENMQPLVLANLDRGVHFLFIEQGFLAPMNDRQVVIEVQSNIRACNNLIDDDLDDLIDLADPGCEAGLDDSEADPPVVPECFDGVDNDEDGAIDWPDDDGCDAAGDPVEAPVCDLVDDVVQVPVGGGRFMTDTRNRMNHYESTCGGSARGGEQVFYLRLAAPANIDAEMIAADYDTVLFIRTVCDDPDSLVECDDDGGNVVQSRIQRQLQPGEYFIFVDGFAGDSGTGTLQITLR